MEGQRFRCLLGLHNFVVNDMFNEQSKLISKKGKNEEYAKPDRLTLS